MSASDSPKQTTALAPLTYNGQVVRMKGDAISLTDCWKAAGSPAGRGPSDWLALVSTKEFVSAVEASFNAGNPGIETSKGGRGAGKGATFGHWQIGLAYAKYLDPQFHILCNTYVRERIDGRSVAPVSIADDERSKAVIGNMIKNCSGVAIREALSLAIPQIVDEVVRHVSTDARNVATANVSIREVLDRMHVPSKKRRSLQARIFHRLRTHCLLTGTGAVQCVRTGTWLWPVVEATAFIRDSCADLIREHRDKIDRQGRLKLVPREPE